MVVAAGRERRLAGLAADFKLATSNWRARSVDRPIN